MTEDRNLSPVAEHERRWRLFAAAPGFFDKLRHARDPNRKRVLLTRKDIDKRRGRA